MDDVVWRRVEHRSVWPTLLWSMAMLAFAGIGNGFCNPHFTFLPFYVVPVAFAGWRGGLGVGLVIAFLATVAFALGAGLNPHREMTPEVLAWNTLGRVATFFPLAFLAAQLQLSLETSRMARNLDPLTGVKNRGAFFRRGAAALAAAHKGGHVSALALFDIEELRQINARYGMQRGDVIVSLAARALWESSRIRDVVARTNGGTLAILMPGTEAEEATGVVLQVQQRFKDLTRSIGVSVPLNTALCVTNGPTTTLDEMMVVAESAAESETPASAANVRAVPMAHESASSLAG